MVFPPQTPTSIMPLDYVSSMAIYRFSATIISRGKGQSAVAAAAYRAGEQLQDDRYGERHDYTRKTGVEHTEIIVPQNSPAWMSDRAALWNGVEAAERRKDAQLSREVQLTLPREISSEQRVELVRNFVREEFVARGMVADIAMHNPKAADGNEQPHAHVMLTMRSIENESFGGKVREWNSDDLLLHWRERWAAHTNQMLQDAGSEERIDHRSLETQKQLAEQLVEQEPDDARKQLLEERVIALDREPTPYLKASWYIEQKALEKAAAAGQEYKAITDRGQWLLDFKEKASERLMQAKEIAQSIVDRAAHAWQRLRGIEQANTEAIVSQTAPLGAAEKLQRAEAIGRNTGEEQILSPIERLQRAEAHRPPTIQKKQEQEQEP
jgi:MobA/MobL family